MSPWDSDLLRKVHADLEIIDSQGRQFAAETVVPSGLSWKSYFQFGYIVGFISLLLSFIVVNPRIRMRIVLGTHIQDLTLKEMKARIVEYLNLNPKIYTPCPM